MKYKLIALDMDGTLLKNDKTISAVCIKTIARACEQGAVVTISTGRPVQGIDKYASVIKQDVPVITYNGAMIIRLHSHELLYHTQLTPNAAREVYSFGNRLNTTIIAWSNNTLYASKINDWVNKYKLISGLEPVLINDFNNLVEQGITKMVWLDDAEKNIYYQSVLDKEIQTKEVVYCTSHPSLLEFMPIGVSKASAMEKLGEILDIKQEEMIAVGDGDNDLSMIEYAGLGVAMENASPLVLKKADYITASNENDGVARIIEKFILF